MAGSVMSRILARISVVWLLLALTAVIAEGSVHVEDEEVVFLLRSPGAERVYIVGDFNGWNPTIDRLIDLEGRFEIRLYLVPGRYRYRFIVDGNSIPDPDNPALDEDGNSVFRLTETSDGFEVTTGGAGRVSAGIADELALMVEMNAVAGDYRDALHAAARIEGKRGERIEARLSVGCEITIRDDELERGDVLFTRASGIYNFEKGRLEVFTRAADLDFGDPVSLFGSAGIYRYRLGSYCRGLLYEGRLPLGVEGKAFFANRLEGPEGRVETADESAAGILFDGREVTDSDIMGLRLDGKLWKAKLAYLMRSDKRPYHSTWTIPSVPDLSYTGYEKVRIDGFVISLEGDGPVTVESELLFGESWLSSLEARNDGETGSVPHESEWEWQEGVRFYSGVRYGGDNGGFLLSIDQTVLDGDPGFGEENVRFVERAAVRCAADRHFTFGYIGARGAVERYGSGIGGGFFWLRNRNFFLDGDDITIGRLPFVESNGLYELEILFAQPVGGGPDDSGITAIRDIGKRFEPFALPLVASFTERGDRGGGRVRELRFSKGADLHDLIRFFIDARYVSYRIDGWEGENDFLDLFVALRGRIGDDSWVSLGVGVDPSLFDGWLYRRTGYGRERYIMERGLREASFQREELLGALEEGERALSEEWSITFEAFVRFW
jgi:hypothetical protein